MGLDSSTIEKVCSKCLIRKPIKEFYKYLGCSRGDCKECFKKVVTLGKKDKLRPAYDPIYYAENKEAFDGYRRTFIKKNPDYFRDYQRAYRSIVKEKEKNVA